MSYTRPLARSMDSSRHRAGKAQGIKDSAARLRRQAEVKFGEAVAKRLGGLLGKVPTASQLDRARGG